MLRGGLIRNAHDRAKERRLVVHAPRAAYQSVGELLAVLVRDLLQLSQASVSNLHEGVQHPTSRHTRVDLSVIQPLYVEQPLDDHANINGKLGSPT